MTEKMSQFGHNISKGRLVNTIMASINTVLLRNKQPKCLNE